MERIFKGIDTVWILIPMFNMIFIANVTSRRRTTTWQGWFNIITKTGCKSGIFPLEPFNIVDPLVMFLNSTTVPLTVESN